MFSAHDVVRLKSARPQLGLAAGQLGTIVMRYAADPPAYEVEFQVEEIGGVEHADDREIRLFLLTVEETEIAPVRAWPFGFGRGDGLSRFDS